MREKIIGLLRKSDKALSIDELQDKLGINDVDGLKLLNNELEKLEEDVLVYHTNKHKYMLFEDSHLTKGFLHVNKKGYGFVDVEEDKDDIFIKEENLNGALHGDLVIVEIISKKGDSEEEGRILRIVKRPTTKYVGEINFRNNNGYVVLDDNKIKIEIEVRKEDSMNSVDGHKVVVELGKKINNHKYQGKVIEIIGHKNDPGVDIASVMYKYDINTEFPDDVKEELKTLPMEVREEDLKGRKDLRNEVIFTIDGDDTKDIDDAISIKKLSNGHFQLGVHIADVSYYVKEGTALDNEAMERGTSVYLVDRVVPMLPHELSNGICSLNPNVDRLAISCVMEFDGNGKRIDYSIFPSVIKSRIQMTYKNVNKILDNNEVPEGYNDYVRDLKLMNELAKILRSAMVRRGYIDFEVDEAKIIVDENCVPTDIKVRERGTGEMLIEDFMIAANECVATHIYFMNLPFIYRVHEVPKEEKIRSYLSFIGNLGYKVVGNACDFKPKAMQKLINYLSDKPEFKILSSLLLRSMQKAIYSPDNIGHYGLASPCYTHFTSPIRRYPDTTVHRLLRTYLFDCNINAAVLRHWQNKLVYVADHSSSRERASVDCEREVEDMKMAEYMEQHIGEEFEGMISTVANFGMFVELDNLIEGLVPIKDMDDFYHYDEDRMTLTGERNHEKYSIGDRVLIKVVRASKTEKIIDFEIIRKL